MPEQNEKPSTTASISSKYVLISVEKTEAPEGLPGNNWHQYIIERGNSQIVGKKPGSLKIVTEHAKAMIADLNERSGIPSSSTYASRQISKTKDGAKKVETKDEDKKTESEDTKTEPKDEDTKTETKDDDTKTETKDDDSKTETK